MRSKGITVWGSLQCPYYVHKALCALFDLPAEKIRVVQMETGGGFGGKEEYPSMIAGHAALLALEVGTPGEDDLRPRARTWRRPPSAIRRERGIAPRSAATDAARRWTSTSRSTAAPTARCRRSCCRAERSMPAGPYFWPERARPRQAVATNAPPHGAFRGFGAPQSIFALERHMDESRRPSGFRRRNSAVAIFIKPGQTLRRRTDDAEPVDMTGSSIARWRCPAITRKRARFAEGNPARRDQERHRLRGVHARRGLHRIGRGAPASVVAVEGSADGSVRVLSASTEIGQGTNTIFSQIAADALGIDYEDIDIVQPDTSTFPNSGPTVASRTCMVVGQAGRIGGAGRQARA